MKNAFLSEFITFLNDLESEMGDIERRTNQMSL